MPLRVHAVYGMRLEIEKAMYCVAAARRRVFFVMTEAYLRGRQFRVCVATVKYLVSVAHRKAAGSARNEANKSHQPSAC